MTAAWQALRKHADGMQKNNSDLNQQMQDSVTVCLNKAAIVPLKATKYIRQGGASITSHISPVRAATGDAVLLICTAAASFDMQPL